ncbi:glycosyltransferase [[Limnothrix rosea] IAM M-220]|uniref:glycosyltransferase n=1 Tax=[Limnothrix rosea] IAM M-220 TaxID=454133 RepID=UPI001CECBAD3|nr:glycosyltransferase [[Limnothrix rosea] IAM M-220]
MNASDVKGGAAKVGYLLAKGLIERHHEVCYLVKNQSVSDSFIQEIPAPKEKSSSRSIPERIIHRLGINELGLTNPFPYQLERDFLKQFDLIHLHDLPSFNLSGLPWLTRQVPTVWTLHSMAPFTGNCSYSYDCDRWQKNCGNCPQFGQFPLLWYHRDGSRLNLNLKRLIYRFSNLHIVGVSQWISDAARQSVFGHLPVSTILNPVQTDNFFPIADKLALRQELNIPLDASVILFSVSGKIEDNRKGLDLMLAALPQLALDDIYLIPLGIAGNSKKISEAFAPYAHRNFEHISDVVLLNKLLNAADVVWHPSRADNLPLMVIEAFAAGTPVIAAAVGGVPEIMGDRDVGLSITPDSSQALVEATQIFFRRSPKERQIMGERAVSYAIETFSLDQFLTAHETLFKSLLP